VITGNPAALLRSISLRVHQILPTMTAHIQKPLDGVGRMVVNEQLQERTGDWSRLV
jgi:hypothetical protein